MNIKLKPKTTKTKKYFKDIPVGTKFILNEIVFVKVKLNEGSENKFYGLDKTNMKLKNFDEDCLCFLEINDVHFFSDLKNGVLFSYGDDILVKRETEEYVSLIGKTSYIHSQSVVTILVPDLG